MSQELAPEADLNDTPKCNRQVWLYFGLFGTLLFIVLVKGNYADLDLWGKIAIGALFEQRFPVFPDHDVFSFTAPDAPWIDHEWGSGVIFYWLLTRLGSPSLFVLKCLLLFGLLALGVKGYFMATRHDQPKRHWLTLDWLFIMMLPLFMGALIPFAGFTIRCHLWSYLFFGVSLMMMAHYKRTGIRKWVLCLPLLSLFWVNVHGGFVLGWFVLGCYWLGVLWEEWRTPWRGFGRTRLLGWTLLACMATIFLNPYGWDFVTKIVASWFMSRGEIYEWRPVWDQTDSIKQYLYPALFVVGCGVALLAVWRWIQDLRQSRAVVLPVEAGIILFTGVEGLLHVKLFPLFVVAMMFLGFSLLPGRVLDWVEGVFKGIPEVVRWFGQTSIPVGLGMLGVCFWMFTLTSEPELMGVKLRGDRSMTGNQGVKFQYPIGAVRYLSESHVKGTVWCPFAWGEYLMWRLYPDVRVSMDGRFEAVYPVEVFKDAHAFYNVPYKLKVLFLYGPDIVMLPVSDKALVVAFEKRFKWRVLYGDGVSRLYENPHRVHMKMPVVGEAYSNSSVTLETQIGDLSRFAPQP